VIFPALVKSQLASIASISVRQQQGDEPMTILHDDEPIDLKDRTPDSWCCVDCGMNTAPGTPPRRLMAFVFQQAGMDAEVKSCITLGQRGLHRSRQRMEEGGHCANGRVPVYRLP